MNRKPVKTTYLEESSMMKDREQNEQTGGKKKNPEKEDSVDLRQKLQNL